jgi:hypothetical protein
VHAGIRLVHEKEHAGEALLKPAQHASTVMA